MDFLNELRFQPLSFSTRDQESVLLRLSLFKSKFEPKTIFNASQTSDPAMPLSVRFAHKMNSNDIFCLSGESGSLRIYKNENVELVEAHDNAVFDVRWLDEDKKILTASADQTCNLIDIESKTKIQSLEGHSGSVRSIAVCPSNESFLCSCSRDGSINLWDSRQNCNLKNSPICTVLHAHHFQYYKRGKRKTRFFDYRPPFNPSTSNNNNRQNNDQNRLDQNNNENVSGRRMSTQTDHDSSNSDNHGVSSVNFAFNDRNVIVSTGSLDGKVKLWDLRKASKSKTKPPMIMEVPFKNASTGLPDAVVFGAVSPSGDRFVGTCFGSTSFYCDLGAPTADKFVLKGLKGAKTSSFYVKTAFSLGGDFFVSGGSNSVVSVWDLSKEKMIKLKKHKKEVSGVDWCKHDFTKIVTCSDDKTTKLWTLGI